MSVRTVYFITAAKDLNHAQHIVESYLEFVDICSFSCKPPKFSGSLAQKRRKLVETLKRWNWKKRAGDLLLQAEQYKAGGFNKLYGNILIGAGVLYAQRFSIDTCIFNIQSGDYSIPLDDECKWVICMNLYH